MTLAHGAPASPWPARSTRWCNLRFLMPVYFIDEVEFIGSEAMARDVGALLQTLGMFSIPKMKGSKIISEDKVKTYHDAQRARAKAMHTADKAADGPDESKGTASSLPECSVCLSTPSGALMLPCGHTSTCHACALHLVGLNPYAGENRCPICREPIERVLQADCPVKAETGHTVSSGPSSWIGRLFFR